MKGLVGALGMFTILPVPPTMDLDERTRRRIMLAFPWAGLVCGLLSALAAGIVLLCDAGDLLAAMVGLAALAGVTGAMHLDGSGDTADGLASRKGPEDALALMRKSDIGPMAVATIILVLLVQAAALASPALVGTGRLVATSDGASFGWERSARLLLAALVCMPTVGRVAATNATVQGIPGARPGGFGSLFTGITSPLQAALDAVAVLLVCAASGWLASGSVALAAVFVVAALASWAVAWRWQEHLLRRLGGLTGDTFGSLIEVSQTAFVILLVLGCGALG